MTESTVDLAAPCLQSEAAAKALFEGDTPLELIHFCDDNAREDQHDVTTQDELRTLGKDMLRHGQLQPIGLRTRHPGVGYDCIWGKRRVQAARLVGMTHLWARVFDREVDAALLSAAENQHRRPMTPLEEAAAVRRLLKRFSDLPESKATDQVGVLLGRSGSWVRDRLFLVRLAPDAAAAVNDGRLPLGHARELAKCVDPAVQAKLLHNWLEYPPSMDDARADVFENQGRLAQVGWDLDAPGVFKGAPACTGCPHNSAVAATTGLFEHDDDAPELAKPRCLDRDCFLRKQGAVEKALVDMATAAVGLKGPKREEAVVGAAPVWMASKTIDDAVRRAAPNAPAPAKKPTKAEREEEERKRAEREKQRDEEAKADQARRAADNLALAARPGMMALAVMLEATRWSSPLLAGQRPNAELKRLGARLAAGTIDVELLDSIAASEFSAFRSTLDELGCGDRECDDAVLRYLRGMLLGDEAPKAAPAPAAKPAPKKKAPKRKKARKPALKGGLD